MGHKRIALEAGEDPDHCPIDYILESMDMIYQTGYEKGEIRRINVNIAATTVKAVLDKRFENFNWSPILTS
jgi:2-iminoacetate synthase